MSDAKNAQAHYLAANGERAFKNKMQMKGKLDKTQLDVLEIVEGDAHTFDLWVSVTDPDGTMRAIRPSLIAWIDLRSRRVLGDIICETPNAALMKQSIIKMIYDENGGVPKQLHIDNGKEFTAKTLTGQSRKERQMQLADFDSEVNGFFQQMCIEKWSRALPYEPWSKGTIERFFGRVCSQFSKWFASYTGTLTGSKTSAKRNKDINKMLENGELFTLEEFYEIWSTWLKENYHASIHRGLKDAGEEYVTPNEVFMHAPRYVKEAPPRDYAASLLMIPGTALVRNQGIYKFGTTYTGDNLCFHVGETVKIRWDAEDVTMLHVFDADGNKICEAVSHELLLLGDKVSQEALVEHIRQKKRHMKGIREHLEELRIGDQSRAVNVAGTLNLTLKPKTSASVIRLPDDKEYRSEVHQRKRRDSAPSDFLQKQGMKARAALEAMNQ